MKRKDGDREFHVDVRLYRDGTIVATSADIRGFVLEVSSFDALIAETQRVGERLLQTNHGLSGDDMANVAYVLRARWVNDDGAPARAGHHPSVTLSIDEAAALVA